MRPIIPVSCILILISLFGSATPSQAVNYINDWHWTWTRATQTLAPNVNPLVLNPATWGSWDPYINYIIVTAKSAEGMGAAGRPTDKAAYIIDWDWVVNQQGIAGTNQNPLVLDPATWVGFSPVWTEMVVADNKTLDPEWSARADAAEGKPTDKAAYIIDWNFTVTAAGVAMTNQNPLVLDPDTWTGFSPVWTEMIIGDGSPFPWTRVTFTQTAGPIPNAFDAVILSGQLSNCGTSILNAGCVEIGNLPPGLYAIDVVVEPGLALTQVQVQVLNPGWTRVTFTQTAGPMPNAFDAVIDRGDLSNCGTSILNAECVEIGNLPPGLYAIDVVVEPGFALTQAQIQIIDNTPWYSVTFNQTAGPVPNVFGPLTVYNGEVSNCASILDAQCRYIGNVQPGIYGIQATMTFVGNKAPVTRTIPLEVGSGTVVVSGGATPAVSSAGLIVLGLSILTGGGVLVRRSRKGA
ncbi:MAG: hypothetical protein AB7V45_00460 [Candidatus Krumholzibacteriia bacterium]